MTHADDHVCGVYRGLVLSTRSSGVAVVQVPTLLGMDPIEAQPCRPPTNTDLPSVGDGVWIAFEGGDVEHPVWLGVW